MRSIFFSINFVATLAVVINAAFSNHKFGSAAEHTELNGGSFVKHARHESKRCVIIIRLFLSRAYPDYAVLISGSTMRRQKHPKMTWEAQRTSALGSNVDLRNYFWSTPRIQLTFDTLDHLPLSLNVEAMTITPRLTLQSSRRPNAHYKTRFRPGCNIYNGFRFCPHPESPTFQKQPHSSSRPGV